MMKVNTSFISLLSLQTNISIKSGPNRPIRAITRITVVLKEALPVMLVSNWSRDEMKLLTDVSVPDAAVCAFIRPQLSTPLSRPLLRA